MDTPQPLVAACETAAAAQTPAETLEQLEAVRAAAVQLPREDPLRELAAVCAAAHSAIGGYLTLSAIALRVGASIEALPAVLEASRSVLRAVVATARALAEASAKAKAEKIAAARATLEALEAAGPSA